MSGVLRFLYTAFSLGLLVIIYLIRNSCYPASLNFSIQDVDLVPYLCYAGYFLLLILLSYCLIPTFRIFNEQSLSATNITGIESADGTFLPVYLAYVFIGLSIDTVPGLISCLLILTIICFKAQTYLFNPVFYLLVLIINTSVIFLPFKKNKHRANRLNKHIQAL